MAIFRYTFPIPNYYNDGVFMKHVYFEAEDCPSHPQVVAALKKKHSEEVELSREHPEWGPWVFEYQGCLTAIEQIKDDGILPRCGKTQKQVNTFCNTDFGSHPLTCYRVELLPLSD